MLLPIYAEHPEPRKIQRAVERMRDGALIGYPTDTVYGLGCDSMNKGAIERLYQAKSLPRKKSLALICPDLSDIAKYAVVDNAVYRVLKRYLPGPYCFVLPATREVPKMLLTKQKTVGIRVPNHPVPVALARELGHPVLSTTAARDSEAPLFDPWEIEEQFPALEMVLDGGAGGLEPTTVVDLSSGQPEILRKGAGPVDDFV